MNLHTSSSILVWIAVMYFTRVLSYMNELQKSELAARLNMLLLHPGWHSMSDVQIWESYTVNDETQRTLADPMSVIFEAMSSNQMPIDKINVFQRYDQIWTVLKCKYAEVIEKYRAFIQIFIRICRDEKRADQYTNSRDEHKTPDSSHPKYFNCFHSLLTKLYTMSPRFKCMTHALDFFYSIGPKIKPNQNIVVATRKLTEYTLTLKPNTLSKFSKDGINEDVVDLEIHNISKYFTNVLHSNLGRFVDRYCNLPSPNELNPYMFVKGFQDKKLNNLIPWETTILQYVEDEIDVFIGEIFDRLFFKLGFVYGVEDNVSIGTI